MRTLYLLRHAKSSWKDASLADFERPLKGRGREAAEAMGRFLHSKKINLGILISSPSIRTRQTVEIVLRKGKLGVEPQFDQRIYEASLSTLVQVVSEIPDDTKAAMLVGHNPGMEELLAFLTRESRHMPTCALARISLESYVTPKDLDED
jgi:phosphohistidine phosphatase